MDLLGDLTQQISLCSGTKMTGPAPFAWSGPFYVLNAKGQQIVADCNLLGPKTYYCSWTDRLTQSSVSASHYNRFYPHNFQNKL